MAVEGSNGGCDHEALKGFVDRLFNVERDFADVKAEYTDSKKDLKAEVKAAEDEHGVTWTQVQELVKVRMNEAEALDHQADLNANMLLYEQVYGFNAVHEETASDDEDDALS